MKKGMYPVDDYSSGRSGTALGVVNIGEQKTNYAK